MATKAAPQPIPRPIVIRRVKKVVGGGHHGGAWKVAYADFVTAMMAFFMLLWLISNPDQEQVKGLAEYFSPSTASISGSLDDLASLPTMRAPANDPSPLEQIETGRRNQTLWRECMARARDCGSLSELVEVAVQQNRTILFEPLPDQEVLRIVASAWSKDLAGENWFGRGSRVVLDAAEIDGLLNSDPDAFLLLTMLRRHHWRRQFVIANAMAATMPCGGWSRQRFAAARRRLIEAGAIEEIRPASRHNGPAVYQFKGGR
jgi:hypothetical protein